MISLEKTPKVYEIKTFFSFPHKIFMKPKVKGQKVSSVKHM